MISTDQPQTTQENNQEALENDAEVEQVLQQVKTLENVEKTEEERELEDAEELNTQTPNTTSEK